MPDRGTSWIEKCGVITFYMLVMGVVAVLEWEVMFLDARDYANLSPLPVRVRTLFAAKFASLCLFVVLFALSLNSMSTLFFVLYLPRWQSSSMLYALGFALVHVVSMFLACFFAFFFTVLLIGILMTILGYKLFNRVSTYIRSFFLIVHVLLIIMYLRGLYVGIDKLIPVEKIKASSSKIHYFYNYFPPLWFTDLYESLLGNTSLPFHGSLNYALLGLVLMASVFYLTTGLSYRRYIRELGSVQRKRLHLKALKMAFSSVFNNAFLRIPVQRAIFHFYKNTLKASMFHKMRLASFVAIGVGLILFQIPRLETGPKTLLSINKTMLTIPIILSFFLLLGLKGIVNMPFSLNANWIFRLTEWKIRRHYFSALRKGIFFLNLLPLYVVLFIFYLFLWDGLTAFYHCLYCLAVSLLVMEVFFLKNFKIPFACSYLPGKEKIQLFWLIYILAFVAFINLVSWIEFELLRAPLNFFIFYGFIFFIILGIRIYQVFFLYKKNSIQYEEHPEPVMVGLDYKTPRHKRIAK
ncbi:MAG: hypothetical protein ACETWK_00870 [Candidatus Aminicenantaceae bacterium]